MTTVRRALAFSIAERYVLILLALASGILIARLLTPEEIGIYSVSLAVVGIAQVLRDFGIGNFLIQEKNLTENHLKTAFGLSLLIGGTLFIVILAAAPFAATFYDEPRMQQTMQISALNFLILPFCSISLALLRREMAFQSLAIVTVGATFVGFVITVALAAKGYGQNSLAIGSACTNLSTGIGTWLARSDRKLLLPSLVEWRGMTKFGAQSSVASVVTSISMDINDLLLGKLLGFAPVAMISRAQGLMNLFHRDFMSAIRNVTYPSFAKAHREGESLEHKYIYSVTMVTAFAWPFYGFTALYSIEIVRLMFGPQWDEAASLVPIFCTAGAFAATANLITSLMMAVGRNDLVMTVELIFQPFRAVLIVVCALWFNTLFACSIAYMVAFAIYVPFLYFAKKRYLFSDTNFLVSNLIISIKVTLLTLLVPGLLSFSSGIGRQEPLGMFQFIGAIGAVFVSWAIAINIFKHPVVDDPVFKGIVKKLNLARER